jgi:hypothetical protein
MTGVADVPEPTERAVAGRSILRRDLLEKVTGRAV